MRDQFSEAEVVEEWRFSPRLPFRSSVVSGAGFTLLPSAAAFIDPLFSTGFALTLLGIERIASALSDGLGSREFERKMEANAAATLIEADAAAGLVSAAYDTFQSFPLFTGLAAFYLAAVSFAETCYRLGDAERASGFLANRDAAFTAGFRECVDYARSQLCAAVQPNRPGFIEMVAERIEPRNRNTTSSTGDGAGPVFQRTLTIWELPINLLSRGNNTPVIPSQFQVIRAPTRNPTSRKADHCRS